MMKDWTRLELELQVPGCWELTEHDPLPAGASAGLVERKADSLVEPRQVSQLQACAF